MPERANSFARSAACRRSSECREVRRRSRRGPRRGPRRPRVQKCFDASILPRHRYDFLMMSFAVDGTKWVDARFSNILTVSPVSVGGAPPVPAPGGDASRGIWMDRYQLMSLPTSGPAWERVVADAERASESAEIADADSDHDVHTMAAALVCVRTQDLCDLARDAVVDAIGTERGGRWLAVGRNLGAYVIAADLLDLRADDDPRSAG